MLAARDRPREVTTDLAAPLLRVIDDLLAEVLDDTTQYANNRIECDHGRLKSRLRPMRGLRTDWTASTVIRGHGFGQNLRRGHYELGVEARHERLRVAAAFDELAEAIWQKNEATPVRRAPRSLNATVPREIRCLRSSMSRELALSGGCDSYRAGAADQATCERARRAQADQSAPGEPGSVVSGCWSGHGPEMNRHYEADLMSEYASCAQ